MPFDPLLLPDCSQLVVPTRLPLMVLSDCWLLPHTTLPLYIFEPRYRLMLQEVMASHRMFGIGTRLSDGSNDIHPVVTAGVVDSCQVQPDGKANLVLLGVRRMKVTAFHPGAPYPSAEVEPLPCEALPGEQVSALHEEIIAQLAPYDSDDHERSTQSYLKMLCALPDPEAVCDVFLYHFVRRPELLAESITLTSTVARYEHLLHHLKKL
jgi:Lon protease-like protein